MTKILIIGVGGAGTNISQFLIEHLRDSAELLLINSDMKSLNKHSTTDSVFLDLTLSLAPTLPQKFTDAVQRMKNEIFTHVQGKTHIVVVTGLGGDTGTYSIPAIAHLMSDYPEKMTVFTVLPFRFEESRRRLAEQELTTLKSTFGNQIIEFDNDSVMDRGLSLTEAFHKANVSMLNNIRQQKAVF